MPRMCQLPNSIGLVLAWKIAIRYVPVTHASDSTVPPQPPELIAKIPLKIAIQGLLEFAISTHVNHLK